MGFKLNCELRIWIDKGINFKFFLINDNKNRNRRL